MQGLSADKPVPRFESLHMPSKGPDAREYDMATLDMSEPNFADTIENNELVILDFWAEWCGPCKAYGPVYERGSEAFPDVVFGKVNTEEQQGLAGMFGIRSIPTTIAFKEGIGVFMQPGALPEDALKDLIEQLKTLDMDEVRAEMAAQEAEAATTGIGE